MDSNTQVTIDLSGAIPIVTAMGELDIATAPMLLERMNDLPIGTTSVIVDLSAVTFLDSTALGALIACEKRLENGTDRASVHLVISRAEILKLFDITGLSDVFPITPTLEEAIAEA